MGYEKKIEPLTSLEAFLAGLTLQMFICMYFIFPMIAWAGSCLYDFDETDSDYFYQSAHNCFTKMRGECLAIFSIFLLGLPIIIGHVHYNARLGDTVTSWLNIGLFRQIYRGAWGITSVIFCVIIPSLGIFIFYYDWELNGNFLIEGYKIQFKFWQFLTILWNCGWYPLGLVAAIPWISAVIIVVDFRLFRSKNWSFPRAARQEYITKMVMPGGGKCCCLSFFSIMAGICIFASLAVTLDYDDVYYGNGEFLWALLFFAFQLQAIVLIARSFKLKQHQQFLDRNIKAIH